MASDAKSATSFEEGLKGASEKVAEFHEEKSALKRLQHWLHQTPSAVPMIVLVVALIIFGFLSENFFKATTLSTILQQIAIVGIIGGAAFALVALVLLAFPAAWRARAAAPQAAAPESTAADG